MNSLKNQLEEIKHLIPESDKLCPAVSAATVGWHLQHILLVINSVVSALENADPGTYKSKTSFIKMMVLWTAKIPRGKAKAPKNVAPTAATDARTNLSLWDMAEKNIAILPTLPSASHFPHPFFGSLKLKRACRFLQIHTEHHLKIARDIMKA